MAESRDEALAKARQELRELYVKGETKRQFYKQEQEKLTSIRDNLRAKWLKNRKRTPLHNYATAMTQSKSSRMVPSTVLSQQARLCQALHLMEVHLRQKNLVQSQHRQYVTLFQHQAAQIEEEKTMVEINMMNSLCQKEEQVKEMMERLGQTTTTTSSFESSDSEEDDGYVVKTTSKKPIARQWWPPVTPSLDLTDVSLVETKETTSPKETKSEKESSPKEAKEQTAASHSWWSFSPKQEQQQQHEEKVVAPVEEKVERAKSWWPAAENSKAAEQTSFSSQEPEKKGWWPIHSDHEEALQEEDVVKSKLTTPHEKKGWWPMHNQEEEGFENKEGPVVRHSWWPMGDHDDSWQGGSDSQKMIRTDEYVARTWWSR